MSKDANIQRIIDPWCFMLLRQLFRLKDLIKPPHSAGEYREILCKAIEAGYQIITMSQMVEGGYQEPLIVLRHDIDADPKAAFKFAAIEAEFGIKASYFFRLSTWHDEVIKILAQRGHEIGYHYEEAASYAKKNRIRSKEDLLSQSDQIRAEFACNLKHLRERSGLGLQGIASHGDIANIMLDIGNRKFLQDDGIRSDLKIKYEAYDDIVQERCPLSISDFPSPIVFRPRSPGQVIREKLSFQFLSHPRWWFGNPVLYLFEDLRALAHKLIWRGFWH